MKIEAKIIIDIEASTEADALAGAEKALAVMGEVQSVRKATETRTSRQNRALHLYFRLLADELNLSGKDMKHVIRTAISWSPYAVKQYLWLPLQKARLGKKSTTELTTDEIDKIYDEINRIIGERTGVSVPFPSIESLTYEGVVE